MPDTVAEFLSKRIDSGDFPSAVYLVAEKGEIVMHEALGHAVVEPELILARPDTIYDLASMTKVLVTGLLAAMQVEAGELKLDDRLGEYLDDLGDKAGLSISSLLSHTSGLLAWKPLYLCVDEASQILADIAATAPKRDQGPLTYSDLNFILLQYVIERLTGKNLASAFDEMVARPLGLRETGFDPTFSRCIAASEKGNAFERQTCVELGYVEKAELESVATAPGSDDRFRDDVIWGQVHDGNAYFMGGVAGHAGLFSTAEEVLRIALQFLPEHTSLLRPETCELFRTNLTGGMNEHRSFAFQLASTPDSAAGMKMSPESFGHLGFTGTSMWIDPVKERVFILLTNRTHNHGLPFVNLNSVRRRFHDLVIDILDKKN